MIRRRGVFASILLAGGIVTDASAAEAGRDIAAGCAACHTLRGPALGKIPSLSGIGRVALVTRMQEFKSGARAGTVMPQLARGYTGEQIELVAQWLSRETARHE